MNIFERCLANDWCFVLSAVALSVPLALLMVYLFMIRPFRNDP